MVGDKGGTGTAQERAVSRFDRAPRAVDASSRPLRRAAIISLAVTSVLAMTIAWSIRPAGRLAGPQREMVFISLAGLCLAAVLGMASLMRRGRSRRGTWLDHLVPARQRAVIWLAFAAWLPLALIVVYYRAEATLPMTDPWIGWGGGGDKRWVVAAFLIGALAPMIWLAAAARVLAVARSQPSTWREWATALFPRVGAVDSERPDMRDATESVDHPEGWRRSPAWQVLLPAAGLATAAGLAWYFLGPPWYLTRAHSLGTDLAQESVWLTGFQAIARGHLPYIGVAGVQYGPGTQFVSYLLMRHVTSFSMVGFRQAWALYQWAGASVLFAVFFLVFGYARGLAISLLSALFYPALHEVAFQPGGSFDGFFGWTNPLRYAGMIALVALLPAVIRRCPSWRGIGAGVILGALWGVASYLAQENLIAGTIGALVVGSLLLLSGTSSWRAVRAALAAALTGFLLAWLPTLAFYAIHGDLVQFFTLYFQYPDAAARGYGDTAWTGGPFSLTAMFYALPFLLATGALLTVFDVRPVRIATGWSRERTRLAVTVIITILLYQGALFRSDDWHLTGTVLMVPALVVATASVLPRLLGARRLTAAVLGTAVGVASFSLLPRPASAWTSLRSTAEAPYLDRQRLAADSPLGRPATLAARRIGAGLDRAPGMAHLVQLMNRIHAVVGSRTTYVADYPYGDTGFVYFLADLTPAPVLYDKYTTVFDESQLIAYMKYFQASVLLHTQALVTGSLDGPEAQFFLRRYPGARRITLHGGRAPYYVLLAGLAPGGPRAACGILLTAAGTGTWKSPLFCVAQESPAEAGLGRPGSHHAELGDVPSGGLGCRRDEECARLWGF